MKGYLTTSAVKNPFTKGSFVHIPKGIPYAPFDVANCGRRYTASSYSVLVEDLYEGSPVFTGPYGSFTDIQELGSERQKDEKGRDFYYTPTIKFEDENGNQRWVCVEESMVIKNKQSVNHLA